MKTKVWDMFLVTLSYLHLYPSKTLFSNTNGKSNLLPPLEEGLAPCFKDNISTLEVSLDLSDPQFDTTFLSLEDSELGSSEYYAEDIISSESSFDRNNSSLAVKAPPSLLDFVRSKV